MLKHEVNRGYGAHQKTCYTAALDAGADIVVMVHPDFQYDSRKVPVPVRYFVGASSIQVAVNPILR